MKQCSVCGGTFRANHTCIDNMPECTSCMGSIDKDDADTYSLYGLCNKCFELKVCMIIEQWNSERRSEWEKVATQLRRDF